MSKDVLILGGGIAGLSAAYHLKKEGFNPKVIEKQDHIGGLCASFTKDGFTFDKFVHLSFTKNEYVRQLFSDSVNGQFITHNPSSKNYYKGFMLDHPAQNNLYPLDPKEKTKIVYDFIQRPIIDNPENYEEWLYSQYGYYFSDNFPRVYNRKYWTIEAKDMEVKWVGNRMYKPSIEEVLEGSYEKPDKNFYYAQEMRYPTNGGYNSFLKKLTEDNFEINLSTDVLQIDTENKKVVTNKGDFSYEILLSTLPLNKMPLYIKDSPEQIKTDASHLLNTGGILVSLGFNRPDVPPSLWTYIYDEDILPSRLYSPSLKSPNNAPAGCSSMQAEIYFSKKKKFIDVSDIEYLENSNHEKLLQLQERTINDLIKTNIIKENDVIFKNTHVEPFANIVFDHHVYKSRDSVLDYLYTKQIYTAGRFGKWDYFWSDQSLISGKEEAEKIISKYK